MLITQDPSTQTFVNFDSINKNKNNISSQQTFNINKKLT